MISYSALVFLRRKNKPQKAETAENEKIYVIGDIHGRYDLLLKLLTLVFIDLQENDRLSECLVRLIFLGDVIDRGPDSLKCLQTLEVLTQFGAELILGNHEDLLLRSIAGDDYAQNIWFKYGGLNTLESLGLTGRSTLEDSFDFGERLLEALSPNIVSMLKQASYFLTSKDYFFVHAGVKPGIPLLKQNNSDLLYIREEFTRSKKWHGSVIVHGHSIVESIELHDNRISIDTGAYRSGKLSCLVLHGSSTKVLEASMTDSSGANSSISVEELGPYLQAITNKAL